MDIYLGGTGKAVGYTEEGEWLTYSINVKESGTYKVQVSMATKSENAGVKFYIDGKAITDSIIATQGEDWDTYSAISATTSEISAGEHVLKMEIHGNFVNVDWLEFTSNAVKDSTKTTSKNGLEHALHLNLGSSQLQTYQVFCMNGSFMGSVSASSLAELQEKIRFVVKHNGTYLVRSHHGKTRQIIVK